MVNFCCHSLQQETVSLSRGESKKNSFPLPGDSSLFMVNFKFLSQGVQSGDDLYLLFDLYFSSFLHVPASHLTPPFALHLISWGAIRKSLNVLVLYIIIINSFSYFGSFFIMVR